MNNSLTEHKILINFLFSYYSFYDVFEVYYQHFICVLRTNKVVI